MSPGDPEKGSEDLGDLEIRRSGGLEPVSAIFDQIDLKLLTALCKEPLGTIRLLSDLAGMSPQTCKRRLAFLSKRRILLRVGARVNMPALGLQDIVVRATVPFQNLQKVEEACDLHPYTRYRVRCLGSTNGLVMRFAIPNGSEFQLIQFFEQLVSLELAKDYQLSPTIAEPISTNPDFSSYNLQSDTWRFDWTKWAKQVETAQTELKKPNDSTLFKLDTGDLRLLHLLTVNAREEGKTLAKALHVPEYHVSRRLRFLHDNQVVTAYEVFIGRSVFRFAPGAIFNCRCSLQTTRKVAATISLLPFASSFYPTKEGFMLFSGIPTTGFTKMGEVLLKSSQSVDMMWTDYDSSMRYYFDETSFIPENKQWNCKQSFVVDEPIAQLRKRLDKGGNIIAKRL